MNSNKVENTAPQTPQALPCGVIQDLMPLVRDGVAGPESEAMVKAHLAQCEDCHTLWEALGTQSPAPAALPDDSAVLHKVKARVSLWLLLVIVVGLLLGMAIMGSGRAIGLVFVVFPLTCGIARWFDDGVWKLVPVLAAAIVPIQCLPNLFAMMEHTTPASALFSYFQGVWMPASMLAVICLAGALTASLLRYAVKGKGKKQ